MSAFTINSILLFGSIVFSGVCSFYLLKNNSFFDLKKDEEKALELIDKSHKEAIVIKKDTQDYVQNRKQVIEQDRKKREERIKKIEESLLHKEAFFKKREDRNNELKLKTASLKEETQGLQSSIKRLDRELTDNLSHKTGQAVAVLKEEVINRYEAELEAESMEKLSRHEEVLREQADKTAKKLVINTIQRLCSPTSVESRAVNVVVLKDQVKGKIVGKEAVNIKVFEELLDVDIVFNDLPNVISISAFQLVVRRIAQQAMEKLVSYKGDITPDVVKRAIKASEKETDDELYAIGKKALETMGIKHEDKEFVRILGRLQYRTSYGQNIMRHSMEVGWAAAMLGSEIGLNPETSKIAGFLHDLGKAVDQDPNVKDAHDYLTKELMERFGFSWEEVHAAWTHHDAIPMETPEALIVKAADSVSASRPGARQESFDRYIERIKLLQETAESFKGVKKAFAVAAGRELRAIVDPEVVDDEGIKLIAKSMAEKVEKDVTYPGQIKINVIRRTKFTETAN